MKKTIHATINFTIDKDHPDYDYVKEPQKPITFSDTYTIDTTCFNSNDEILSYIKHDLALVAGGGYNTEHIHNVSYTL